MSIEDDLAQLQQTVAELGANVPAAGAGADPYTAALSDFVTPGQFGDERGRIAPQIKPFQESESGAYIKYPNGVVVDQITGQVVAGPWMSDPEVEGSTAWLRTIQEKWDDKTFNQWRKRLNEMGYDTLVSGGIATKGGVAADVIEGLRQYHMQRYLNGGTPLHITPKTRPESIKQFVDMAVVKQTVGTWLDAVDIKDEDTKEFLAQQMVGGMMELQRKHPNWTGEQLQAGAELRAQEKFVKMPGVKGELQDLEDDEMDESLREDAIHIMELGSF